MKVIGTAGHIDHGKSALVRRMTGIDPDRLDEEKRRGMTIDLGFAWFTLPSGSEASVIDVPGHERFIKNMLAGAGGIDLALLVVAADEGVMPQTREHLDILHLLGLHAGVVAVTKSDLVDGELLELVRDEVADVLRGTGLEWSPMVAVSSVTGEGVDRLLEELDRAVAASETKKTADITYLPVDRSFTLAGFGTVVTGTLHGGELVVGQEIELVPSGKLARIRGLQSHRRQVDTASAGARVAVNLAGVGREEVVRGDVIAVPGTVPAVGRFDARLQVLADAPFPLRHGVEVRVHLGAAERRGTVSLLEAGELLPGQSGWIQIRLDAPMAAVRGGRFILRLPAPARTVAGGEVVDVAPRHRRSDPRAVHRLRRLSSHTLQEVVVGAMPAVKPTSVGHLSRQLGVSASEIEETVARLIDSGAVVRIGDVLVGADGWRTLIERTRLAVSDYHTRYPLRRGMPAEQLRKELTWPPAPWPATLRRLQEDGVVVAHGPLVALPLHAGGSAARTTETTLILDVLRRDPFAPPTVSEVLGATGGDLELLGAMADEGLVVRVNDSVVFERSAFDGLVSLVMSRIDSDGEVTVAGVRDAAGTSRKYALALLEYLDAQHLTKRAGDARVRGRLARCG